MQTVVINGEQIKNVTEASLTDTHLELTVLTVNGNILRRFPLSALDPVKPAAKPTVAAPKDAKADLKDSKDLKSVVVVKQTKNGSQNSIDTVTANALLAKFQTIVSVEINQAKRDEAADTALAWIANYKPEDIIEVLLAMPKYDAGKVMQRLVTEAASPKFHHLKVFAPEVWTSKHWWSLLDKLFVSMVVELVDHVFSTLPNVAIDASHLTRIKGADRTYLENRLKIYQAQLVEKTVVTVKDKEDAPKTLGEGPKLADLKDLKDLKDSKDSNIFVQRLDGTSATKLLELLKTSVNPKRTWPQQKKALEDATRWFVDYGADDLIEVLFTMGRSHAFLLLKQLITLAKKILNEKSAAKKMFSPTVWTAEHWEKVFGKLTPLMSSELRPFLTRCLPYTSVHPPVSEIKRTPDQARDIEDEWHKVYDTVDAHKIMAFIRKEIAWFAARSPFCIIDSMESLLPESIEFIV